MNRIRFAGIILILCLLFGMLTGALAYDENTAGVQNMPQQVQQILAKKWPDWEVTGWVNPASITRSTACAFAALHRGTENLLAAFGFNNQGWVLRYTNAAALPQGENRILLGECTEGGASLGSFCAYYILNDEIEECFTLWQEQDDHSWRLQSVMLYQDYPLMFFDTRYEGKLHIYNTGWVAGNETNVWLEGTYQTDLRYFSFTAFPKSVKEARGKLTTAPNIPVGTLQAREVNFTGGEKWDVYSAPSVQSLRGGNGKARVSTNGWIQVFGRDGEWLLIQYSIDKEHYRIGYIPLSALPAGEQVTSLSFEPQTAEIRYNVALTDDPLYSGTSLMLLQANTRVTQLAVMGSWSYVEVNGDTLCRGFVPTAALFFPAEQSHDFAVYTLGGETWDLFEITKLTLDDENRLIAVTGHYTRVIEEAQDGCAAPDAAPNSEVTYLLSDACIMQLPEPSMEMERTITIPGESFYAWYVEAYLNGQAPEGGLIYECDLPSDAEGIYCDFWFVTTRIELDSEGHIDYLEYYYVPWA